MVGAYIYTHIYLRQHEQSTVIILLPNSIIAGLAYPHYQWCDCAMGVFSFF